LLSVVLASFNGERFIAEQIESILPQLGEDDEVVVSDDASTDSTVEVVRAFCDRRVRVLEHEDRRGYVGNFDRAVRACRGDVIFFSDQDDVWLPGKVSSLLKALRHADCAASDARVVDERLRPLHPSYFQFRKTRGFSAFDMYLRPPIVGATLACRRTFVASILPFPAHVSHDTWISLNAALKRRFVVVTEPLILYRRHVGNASLSGTKGRRVLSLVIKERAALLWHLARLRLTRLLS
jgi:glycosyltransferase involved in cell wall biosynthesis